MNFEMIYLDTCRPTLQKHSSVSDEKGSDFKWSLVKEQREEVNEIKHLGNHACKQYPRISMYDNYYTDICKPFELSVNVKYILKNKEIIPICRSIPGSIPMITKFDSHSFMIT